MFVKSEYIEFGEFELGCVIEWVVCNRTADSDAYLQVCEMIKVAK
jgi:hypothetical protein